jgi:hypothetical protein
MKSLVVFALLSGAARAATKVAVLEFGAKRGTVRATTAAGHPPPPGGGEIFTTTPAGVHSFWNALHRARGRGLQHAGMPLVPDLFAKPDLGIVLALKGDGVDLDHMPVVSGLVLEDGSGKASAVVGRMEMEGSRCHALMGKVDDVKAAATLADIKSSVQAHATGGGKGLVGVQATVGNDASAVAEVDGGVGDLLQELQEWAESSGKTVVLHLVVEEEEGSSRRRARSLPSAAASSSSASSSSSSSEQASPKAQQKADGGDKKDRRQRRRLEDEKDGEEQNQQDANSGYYGYGYYNAYGEWVTPYKTMFQIQYFNVVLWTALGLVASLLFVVYLMVYMPLEPDTLLFGESAKLVGSE